MPGTLKPRARDLDSSLGDEGYSADRIAGHSANRKDSQAPLSEQDAQGGTKGVGVRKRHHSQSCHANISLITLAMASNGSIYMYT